MFLMRLINPLFLFLLLVTSFNVAAQKDSTIYVDSPYRSEYNPWFNFTKFKRGFDNDSLKLILDELEGKPRKKWSRMDSLHFARTSLQTGNIKLSNYYFQHLDVNYNTENEFWWEEMAIHILHEDFDEGIERIHEESPGIYQFSKIYFIDKILQAYKSNKKYPKWYKTHTLLGWEIDSTLINIDRNDERYDKQIIIPLRNLDFVLKLLIHYIHDEDPIIANSCKEMGIILEQYVSYTQAYIAFSLGRHYNKWDKTILNELKDVKVNLSKNRFKIPIFRRYFPRIEHWRFEYDVLKEKIILQRQDTIPKTAPKLMLPAEKSKSPFPLEFIIIGGMLIIFIFVAIFTKSKGK